MGALESAIRLILREGDDLGRTVIRKKAEQMALPRAKRIQPTAERLLPETEEAYKRTTDIAAQKSMREYQPDPSRVKNLPARGRMQPLIDSTNELAGLLAERMRPGLGTSDQYFYHTGPIYEAAQDIGGVDPQTFMKRFSAYFGGTSPRTQTEPNLLNTSMLQYRAAEGLPLDKPVLGLAGQGAANDIGYAMITGTHPGLAARLEADPLASFATNPKPSTFAPNVAGNLQGVTADTHAIRGAVSAFEALHPGELPREWFKSDKWFKKYKDEGFAALDLDSALDDSLKSAASGGVKSQVEYGPMADIYTAASEKLGVSPAEAQALGWFGQGAETGLRSENKTVVQLLNDRINVTAQALGLPQEDVAKMYFQGRIPLMGVAGAGVAGGLLGNPEQAQASELTPSQLDDLDRLFGGT